MHFLDDDLELVEGLPKIFREQLTELQSLDKQVETISASVKEAKSRLYSEYAKLSKPEIDERSKIIKENYKKMRNLYTKKCEVSSALEQLMDRINNKVKKDTDDFRCELELENPGCTYEFEKKFTEEYDKEAFYSNRNAEKVSAREAQLLYNGHGPIKHSTHQSSTNRFPTNRHEQKQTVSNRRSIQEKSLKKLLIDTTGANHLNVNSRRSFMENGSTTSSFRPSPVSVDYSPSPSTSRFSTPRHTPGPVSPAIRQVNRQQFVPNGSSVPQSAPANFNMPNFSSDAPNFDPTASAMPSFAGGQESRHGRPRKLTTRVKQMLNEQKVHRYHNSPLSSQGFSINASESDRMVPQRHLSFSMNRGNSSRRQSTSMNMPRQQRRLKRSSVAAIDDEDNASRTDEMMDEEYGSESAEFDDYPEEMDDEDADNQLWCICQTKSYGNMIACDNQSNCPYTWFHYECVGLTESPEDGNKWFCPICRNRLAANQQMAHSSRH